MNSKELPERSYSTGHRQTRMRSQDPGQAHACSSKRILGRALSREAR